MNKKMSRIRIVRLKNCYSHFFGVFFKGKPSNVWLASCRWFEVGSGPALLPGASTRLQHQTILDNHRPASPTNAPAAQFFGPHVACHVREGRFLIAGAPMLREHSGKSRALQVWKALSPAQPHSWVGKVGRGVWCRGRGGTALAGLGSPVPGWQATHILTLREGNICSDPNIRFWDTPSTYVLNLVSFRLKVLPR